jgi:hypothetical protein
MKTTRTPPASELILIAHTMNCVDRIMARKKLKPNQRLAGYAVWNSDGHRGRLEEGLNRGYVGNDLYDFVLDNRTPGQR